MSNANNPCPSELVHASEFEAIVTGACQHPAMYVGTCNFEAIIAYIQGMDAAQSGGPLMGIHQWFVVKRNGGNNLHWVGHFRSYANLDLTEPFAAKDDHMKAIISLGNVLKEFFDYRRERGLTVIFYDYAKWLLNQDWYTGPLRDQRDK